MYKQLRGLEKGAEAFVGRYRLPLALASHEARRKGGATVVETIQAAITGFQFDCGRRMADLLEDIIVLVNGKRVLAAVLAARGFIELCAAAAYLEEGLVGRAVAGIRNQQDLDEVTSLLDTMRVGSTFDWERFLGTEERRRDLLEAYAKGDKEGVKPAHFRRNVETMLKVLDRRFAKVDPGRKGYAVAFHSMLSDICHPAVGGTMLYFDVGSPPGCCAIGAPLQIRDSRFA